MPSITQLVGRPLVAPGGTTQTPPAQQRQSGQNQQPRGRFRNLGGVRSELDRVGSQRGSRAIKPGNRSRRLNLPVLGAEQLTREGGGGARPNGRFGSVRAERHARYESTSLKTTTPHRDEIADRNPARVVNNPATRNSQVGSTCRGKDEGAALLGSAGRARLRGWANAGQNNGVTQVVEHDRIGLGRWRAQQKGEQQGC